jgi:hypothetical protein
LVLSGLGVGLMAVAYMNREKPAWRRDLRAITILAIGQVVLGAAIAAIDLLSR